MNARTRRIALNLSVRLLLALPPTYFVRRLEDGGADTLLLMGLLLTASFMGSVAADLGRK